MITHFQIRETKGKDYFRKAWSFSFMAYGEMWTGVYHQDGTIDWDSREPLTEKKEVLSKEIHRLMGFHVFR